MMGAAPGVAAGAAAATGVGSLFCSRKAVRFDVFKASNGAAGLPAQPMLSAAAPRQKASIFDMRGLLDPLRRGVTAWAQGTGTWVALEGLLGAGTTRAPEAFDAR